MKTVNTAPTARDVRGASIMSIVLGVLAGCFWWWVPLGMVLGTAGLVVGVIDCIIARRRSLTYRLAVVGLVISIAALALDFTIAGIGMQMVTFGTGP